MIKILLSTRLGERKWTQADLARVSLEQLDFICEALNCELDELIVRVPNKTPKIVHTKNGSIIS